MQALAAALRDSEHFRTGRPFLVFYHHFAFERLGSALVGALCSGRTILATADPTYARHIQWPFRHPRLMGAKGHLACFTRLVRAGIPLPYLAHSRAAAQTARVTARPPKRHGIMFHGATRRHDQSLRERMLLSLQQLRAQAVKIDLEVRDLTLNGAVKSNLSQASEYERSGRSYLAASLCLAPAGDTVASRRLFDALSAGCVAVLVRDDQTLGSSFTRAAASSFFTALPFPLSVDWPRATLQLSASGASGKDEADWLRRWLGSSKCELRGVRERGLAAFRKHLDVAHNPRGVADALLRELQGELLKQCPT
eukprot:5205119-Prymnesium_polylepis.1